MINNKIGKKLFELRKLNNYSQEKVADSLFMSQSSYARMEKGSCNTWANKINEICKLYEIEPEELFKDESVIIGNIGTNNGVGYAKKVNQLSENVIEQLELRIIEKDERLGEKDVIIEELRKRIKELEGIITKNN